jgi:hypothetical protein
MDFEIGSQIKSDIDKFNTLLKKYSDTGYMYSYSSSNGNSKQQNIGYSNIFVREDGKNHNLPKA